MIKVDDTTTTTLKLAPGNWTYIVLGVAIALEGALVIGLARLTFPHSLAVFAILAASTTLLFVKSEWFQNKLIGLKTRYESKAE